MNKEKNFASAIIYTEAKIAFMKQHANLNQYYACHNFFPLNETGIAFEDVRKEEQKKLNL